MGTEPNANKIPKVVKLDKALKLAETWVNSMTTSASDEPSEVESEGRPSRLGLGAKLTPKAKVAVSVDQAARRLLGKLNSKKKLTSENVENIPVKENVLSEEDEPESRTRAFVKKRSIPSPATLQSTKKRR
ncbi:uncharacterized protein LOC121996933 [Zingiber officinale]|nr:uncharacterized protein LOC121996932 [Zingiber officinale]XP_042407035.1 uncharacterized protein LOC121996933 [Zingiber officinale]KAG6500329.1 hypothetical protein ZIOFF_040172 [Zingiber officinale]